MEVTEYSGLDPFFSHRNTTCMSSLSALCSMNVWRDSGGWAINKPLFLLLVLHLYHNGADRLIPFRSVESKLRCLLKRMKPSVSQQHPEYPYWYMRNESFWELHNLDPNLKTMAGTPTAESLRESHVTGGIKLSIYRHLMSDKSVLLQSVRDIAFKYFSEADANFLLDELFPNVKTETLSPSLAAYDLSTLRDDPAYWVLSIAGCPLSAHEFADEARRLRIVDGSDVSPLTKAYHLMRKEHRVAKSDSRFVRLADGKWALNEWSTDCEDYRSSPIFRKLAFDARERIHASQRPMRGHEIARLLRSKKKYFCLAKKSSLVDYALSLEVLLSPNPVVITRDFRVWELPELHCDEPPYKYFSNGKWAPRADSKLDMRIVPAIRKVLSQAGQYLHYLEIGRRLLSETLISSRSESVGQAYYAIALEKALVDSVGFTRLCHGVWGMRNEQTESISSLASVLPETSLSILHRRRCAMAVNELISTLADLRCMRRYTPDEIEAEFNEVVIGNCTPTDNRFLLRDGVMSVNYKYYDMDNNTVNGCNVGSSCGKPAPEGNRANQRYTNTYEHEEASTRNMLPLTARDLLDSLDIDVGD